MTTRTSPASNPNNDTDRLASALTSQTIASPVGDLRLVATDQALVAVLWPNERQGRVTFACEPIAGSNDVIETTRRQLDEYFAGTRRTFDVPLDARGTEFQQLVWASLSEIPYGETATYSKQAAAIGRPRSVRAVGAANGRNPLSIVLPCHRVVAADGSLAGFAGGLETKRWLLDHEAAVAAR